MQGRKKNLIQLWPNPPSLHRNQPEDTTKPPKNAPRNSKQHQLNKARKTWGLTRNWSTFRTVSKVLIWALIFSAAAASLSATPVTDWLFSLPWESLSYICPWSCLPGWESQARPATCLPVANYSPGDGQVWPLEHVWHGDTQRLTQTLEAWQNIVSSS